MKYAIIQSGGKQYRVEEGKTIDVELLEGKTGGVVSFSEVLFCHDGKESHVGTPYLSQFVVEGKILEDTAGPKVRGIKYQPRQHQQKQWGHRQKYTRVEITKIGQANEEVN